MIGGIFFSVGVVGLLLSICLFVWEAKTGSRFLSMLRTKLDRTVRVLYRTAVFGEIPRVWRIEFAAWVRRATHGGVNILITTLRAIERPLSRISRRMQYSKHSDADPSRAPSPFLQDMKQDMKEDARRHGKNPRDSV